MELVSVCHFIMWVENYFLVRMCSVFMLIVHMFCWKDIEHIYLTARECLLPL